MVNINDIYTSMDKKIVNEGYHLSNTEEKKKLVDNGLKDYIISKINELGKVNSLTTQNSEQLSTLELFHMLANLIPKENHFDTIRHFTHYILNIATDIQGCYIIWYGDNDEKFLHEPLVDFDINGEWKSLTTHDDTDLVKVFEFVYDIFMNKFRVKQIQKRIDKPTFNE